MTRRVSTRSRSRPSTCRSTGNCLEVPERIVAITAARPAVDGVYDIRTRSAVAAQFTRLDPEPAGRLTRTAGHRICEVSVRQHFPAPTPVPSANAVSRTREKRRHFRCRRFFVNRRSEASEHRSWLRSCHYRSRSKRSRVMTLVQASMKSSTNAACPSSAA